MTPALNGLEDLPAQGDPFATGLLFPVLHHLVTRGARISSLGLNHRRVAPPASLKWTPEFLTVGKDWTTPLPSGIAQKLNQEETLSLVLQYREGGCGLEINAVELLADGKSLAVDRHAGFTGGQSNDNVYKLALSKGTQAANPSVRVTAKDRGGSDSRGEIVISTGR